MNSYNFFQKTNQTCCFFRPTKDVYYDYESEEKDTKTDEEVRKRQTRQTYIKRVIVHPSFHNIGFKEAEKLLGTMEQGDVIVRPSSKVRGWNRVNGANRHCYSLEYFPDEIQKFRRMKNASLLSSGSRPFDYDVEGSRWDLPAH